MSVLRRYPGIGEIDVWWSRASGLDESQKERALSWMSEEERTQHQRFLRDEDRLLYLATRGLVRGALSCYEDISPHLWSFSTDEHGRPWIAGPVVRPSLIFNISHSQDLVVFAVSAGGALGVDVEGSDRRRDILGIAKRFFAEREYKAIRSAPTQEEQEALFSSFWTLKEAYMKARGLGFALEPQWMDFAFAPQLSVVFDEDVADVPKRWALLTGRLSSSHTFSLAASWGDTAPLPTKESPRHAANVTDTKNPHIRSEGQDIAFELVGVHRADGVRVCFLDGALVAEIPSSL